MTLVSCPYRLLALIALAVALVGFGWVKGAEHVQAQWDAAIQQQSLQIAALRQKQAEATVKVVMMRPPQGLRSLPSPEPSSATTRPVMRTQNN